MTKYCFDTSSLIEGWVRSYPIDVFSSFWSKLDTLIDKGIIICPDEVLIELQKKEDDLYEWVKKREKLFYQLDESLQEAVIEILERFPRLVDSKKGRSQGDPFVIGLAKIKNLVVVSGEKNAGNDKNPKIPDVCGFYNIRCITLLQFIREQKWSF